MTDSGPTEFAGTAVGELEGEGGSAAASAEDPPVGGLKETSGKGSSQRRANRSPGRSLVAGAGGLPPAGRGLCSFDCCVNKPTITMMTPRSCEPNITTLFASWTMGACCGVLQEPPRQLS
jgi:hypothetical protein